jgi:hypothetical protein
VGVAPAYFAGTAVGDTALLTAAAIALMSAASCASRVTFKPFAPAAAPAASMALMTTPSTASGSLDIGRLGADESHHGFDGGLVGLRLLEHRQDARFYEFGNLYRVARGGGKGVLHACNQCTHLFLLSRP